MPPWDFSLDPPQPINICFEHLQGQWNMTLLALFALVDGKENR